MGGGVEEVGPGHNWPCHIDRFLHTDIMEYRALKDNSFFFILLTRFFEENRIKKYPALTSIMDTLWSLNNWLSYMDASNEWT